MFRLSDTSSRRAQSSTGAEARPSETQGTPLHADTVNCSLAWCFHRINRALTIIEGRLVSQTKSALSSATVHSLTGIFSDVLDWRGVDVTHRCSRRYIALRLPNRIPIYCQYSTTWGAILFDFPCGHQKHRSKPSSN